MPGKLMAFGGFSVSKQLLASCVYFFRLVETEVAYWEF